MKVKNYRELIVWQKAMDLVEGVYKSSKGFPREEVYALTSQIRRAAVSIPSNIAEGQGKKIYGGVSSPLVYCSRFVARNGDTDSHRRQATLFV